MGAEAELTAEGKQILADIMPLLKAISVSFLNDLLLVRDKFLMIRSRQGPIRMKLTLPILLVTS